MAIENPSISLIVSTYNWPEALKRCLISIRQQTILPNELIIADDGSGTETLRLIKEYANSFPIPFLHVWQEDDGFQLSKIRNKAIARASGEYIIQIDGDLILEKHFIQDHLEFSKTGTFVSGTRIQMSPQLSANVTNGQTANLSVLSRGITNFSNGLRLSFMRNFLAERYKAKEITYVRGCNMAFWKTDLLKVNGYNELIVGWGREDSELAIRLTNSGIKKRILKFGAVAFHIYHAEIPRQHLTANDTILSNAVKNCTRTCEIGLAQYL